MIYSLEELKDFYKYLQCGGRLAPERSKSFKGIVLINDFIHYNNYGSSAVENTIDNLEWLIDVIFEDEKIVKKENDYFVYI